MQYDHLVGRFSGPVHRVINFSGTAHFIFLSGLVFDLYLFFETDYKDNGLLSIVFFCVVTFGAFAWTNFADDYIPPLIYCSGVGGFLSKGLQDSPFLKKSIALNFTMGGVWFILVVIAFIAAIIEDTWPIEPERIRRPLVAYSLLNHTVATLIYLGLHYESSNTNKPHWTNWLG